MKAIAVKALAVTVCGPGTLFSRGFGLVPETKYV